MKNQFSHVQSVALIAPPPSVCLFVILHPQSKCECSSETHTLSGSKSLPSSRPQWRFKQYLLFSLSTYQGSRILRGLFPRLIHWPCSQPDGSHLREKELILLYFNQPGSWHCSYTSEMGALQNTKRIYRKAILNSDILKFVIEGCDYTVCKWTISIPVNKIGHYCTCLKYEKYSISICVHMNIFYYYLMLYYWICFEYLFLYFLYCKYFACIFFLAIFLKM